VKLVTAPEALFSVKSFAAAMLALYVSMRIGLARPFWALMTAYIVAAPFSGPTRSKGLYRAGGTIVGALAALVMVPQLANAPELLSLAIALWTGACLYFSLLDRTPRSYFVMLAGYTAALIAFPAVDHPGTIFDLALARVEEILLGIACATLVHSLVFPQSYGPVLLARLDLALRDAQHWIADALSGDARSAHVSGDARSAHDRRKLAGDITELRLMAVHLPFDTSHLRWTSSAIRALQERLAAMVPLLSAVEDRLRALHQLGALDQSSRWRALLTELTTWTGSRRDQVAPGAPIALQAAIDAIAPAPSRHADWRELLEINLAARLQTLVELCVDVQTLRRHIDAGVHGDLPEPARQLRAVPARALHLDHRLALISAFAATMSVLVSCAFWIITGWPAGSGAPMMAAILSCFCATLDDPVPFVKGYLKYTLWSIPISALYVLVLLPAIHSFEMLALVCAPVFLIMGVVLARPTGFARGIPFLFGVAGTLAMLDTDTADMVSFVNVTLAQLAGISATVLITSVFRAVGAGWVARRLLKAGWSELARLGSGEQVASVPEFSARMVDRIGLLTPRLAMAGTHQDLKAADALIDLRIGLNMAQLLESRPELGRAQASLWPLLEHLSQHFEARPRIDAAGDARLLASLDNALRSVSAAEQSGAQRDALASLAGMRRDMFPDAPPYQPSPILEKEIR
jgi:uncharacterized membrane protein YccC